METSRIFSLFLCALVLKVGAAAFAREPQHTAVITGTSATLECGAGEGVSQVTWGHSGVPTDSAVVIYHRQGSTAPIITGDHNVNYETDPENVDNLIIKQASPDTVGLYTCSAYGGPDGQESDVAAFNAMETPQCEVPQDSDREGSMFDMACSVTYRGLMKPRLTFHYDNQEDLGTVVEDTDDDLESSETPGPTDLRKLKIALTNFTMEAKHDGMTVECRVTFEADDQKANYGVDVNKDMPEYNSSCSRVINVQVKVHDIQFDPNPDDVADDEDLVAYFGSYIKCNASGSDPIDYRWVKDVDESETSGPTNYNGFKLPITENMGGGINSYTCIASNEAPVLTETERKITFVAERDPDSGAEAARSAIWLLMPTLLITMFIRP